MLSFLFRGGAACPTNICKRWLILDLVKRYFSKIPVQCDACKIWNYRPKFHEKAVEKLSDEYYASLAESMQCLQQERKVRNSSV